MVIPASLPPSVRTTPLRFAGAPAPEQFRAVVETTADACERYAEEWQSLAGEAIEPNPFYEPWMLLPALRRLGKLSDQRFVFLFAPSIADPAKEVLCGFFPLQTCRTETALSLTATGFLRHPFCYLRTPLLRARYARECLAAFFDWLSRDRTETGLFEMSEMVSDGPFRQLVTDELYQRGTLTFHVSAYTRGFFRPAASADAYLQQAFSSRHRRELGRKERRLGDQGKVTWRELDDPADVDAWIDRFLHLEQSGWKGRAGTAFAAETQRCAYFREIVRAAAERGCLLGLELCVGGAPAAQRLSFRTGNGTMAYRIAYDEALARYSPGLLLEVENIRRLHATATTSWMDCGAVPYSDLFNKVWIHRRTIDTLLLATGRPRGAVLVSLLPLLRLLNRALHASGLGRKANSTDQEDEKLRARAEE